IEAPRSADVRERVRPRVKGAHIRDSDTWFDWGAIQNGATYQHAFVLHNDGDTPLHINRVRPSCGCMAIAFASDIEAGGEGTLEVTINGPSLRPGKMLARAELTCNDVAGSPVVVILTGRVLQPGEVVGANAAGAQIDDPGLLIR